MVIMVLRITIVCDGSENCATLPDTLQMLQCGDTVQVKLEVIKRSLYRAQMSLNMHLKLTSVWQVSCCNLKTLG